MRRAGLILWLVLVAFFLGAIAPSSGLAQDIPAEPAKAPKPKKKKKKPKKKRKKRKRSSKKRKSKKAEPRAIVPESEEDADTTPDATDEGEPPIEVERKQSVVTPGSASRWSNKGAMEPVESELELSAPLPQRAVPKPVGVETPGQALVSPSEEQLSAHLSFWASHLETAEQNSFAFEDQGVGIYVVQPPLDLELYRGRATLDYDRIGNSEVGAHLDLEYRARSSGTRPTDRRINALYVSYGLSDFRRREGPDWGVDVGRVAVPEAGYAQADGLAFRYRLTPDLKVGILGGLTGNPYRYNWRQHTTEDPSTDYITGGAFGTFRQSGFFLNVAGVLSYASTGLSGIDRVFAFVDTGFAVSDEVDIFANGWIDVLPSGQPVQNVELVGSWLPNDRTDLRISAGRFSTLRYESSTLYSFPNDPNGNSIPVLVNGVEESKTPVDENDQPILAFNAAYQSAIYNQFRLRAGYKVTKTVEPFLLMNLMLRDVSDSPAGQGFSSMRFLPSAGARYRDPKTVDASARATMVIDEESNTDAILRAEVGKGIYGLRLSLDGRLLIGDVGAWDGGLMLSYTIPRSWMPGRLMFVAAGRYFREDVEILQVDLTVDKIDDPVANPLPVIPLQESVLGYAGIDYRL